jgi:hypothetical protein
MESSRKITTLNGIIKKEMPQRKENTVVLCASVAKRISF